MPERRSQQGKTKYHDKMNKRVNTFGAGGRIADHTDHAEG
jgi:hypothetical protein